MLIQQQQQQQQQQQCVVVGVKISLGRPAKYFFTRIFLFLAEMSRKYFAARGLCGARSPTSRCKSTGNRKSQSESLIFLSNSSAWYVCHVDGLLSLIHGTTCSTRIVLQRGIAAVYKLVVSKVYQVAFSSQRHSSVNSAA